jgi:hypothetical protein
MAMGFFIDLKLAGTTQGLGWATKETLISRRADPINNNLSIFIFLDINFRYKDNNKCANFILNKTANSI